MTCLCNVKVEKHPSSLEGFEAQIDKVAIRLRTHMQLQAVLNYAVNM